MRRHRIAIAGAMKTLQETNRKLREENLRLRAETAELATRFRTAEERHKRDRETWQKELLDSLSHSSEREQQLKATADAQQRELLDLKTARSRLESSVTKLENSLKSERLQLANARKKTEQVSREAETQKEAAERRGARDQEIISGLEDRLAGINAEKDELVNDFNAVAEPI